MALDFGLLLLEKADFEVAVEPEQTLQLRLLQDEYVLQGLLVSTLMTVRGCILG